MNAPPPLNKLNQGFIPLPKKFKIQTPGFFYNKQGWTLNQNGTWTNPPAQGDLIIAVDDTKAPVRRIKANNLYPLSVVYNLETNRVLGIVETKDIAQRADGSLVDDPSKTMFAAPLFLHTVKNGIVEIVAHFVNGQHLNLHPMADYITHQIVSTLSPIDANLILVK